VEKGFLFQSLLWLPGVWDPPLPGAFWVDPDLWGGSSPAPHVLPQEELLGLLTSPSHTFSDPKAPCDGGKAPALRAGGPKHTVWAVAPLSCGLSSSHSTGTDPDWQAGGPCRGQTGLAEALPGSWERWVHSDIWG